MTIITPRVLTPAHKYRQAAETIGELEDHGHELAVYDRLKALEDHAKSIDSPVRRLGTHAHQAGTAYEREGDILAGTIQPDWWARGADLYTRLTTDGWTPPASMIPEGEDRDDVVVSPDWAVEIEQLRTKLEGKEAQLHDVVSTLEAVAAWAVDVAPSTSEHHDGYSEAQTEVRGILDVELEETPGDRVVTTDTETSGINGALALHGHPPVNVTAPRTVDVTVDEFPTEVPPTPPWASGVSYPAEVTPVVDVVDKPGTPMSVAERMRDAMAGVKATMVEAGLISESIENPTDLAAWPEWDDVADPSPLATQPDAAGVPCPACNDSGVLSSMDGETTGVCACQTAEPAPPWECRVCDNRYAMPHTHAADTDGVVLVDKLVEPTPPVELSSTTEETCGWILDEHIYAAPCSLPVDHDGPHHVQLEDGDGHLEIPQGIRGYDGHDENPGRCQSSTESGQCARPVGHVGPHRAGATTPEVSRETVVDGLRDLAAPILDALGKSPRGGIHYPAAQCQYEVPGLGRCDLDFRHDGDHQIGGM